MNQDKWFRIEESIEYAKVSKRTFRDWLYKLGLKHSRVGGVVLIKRDDIDHFIETHVQDTGETDRIVEEVMDSLGR